jgi:hypothetical protein
MIHGIGSSVKNVRAGPTASMISRAVSTISANVSSVRLSGWGESHTPPREPARLTQQRAPTRSASASRVLEYSIAAARSASSGLIGLLPHEPISAITMSACAAASAYARTSSSEASSGSGQ